MFWLYFHFVLFSFFPAAIPQANITLVSADRIMAGTNVTLLCTWNPDAQDAYFVRWNWRNIDGEYMGAKSFYSYNYAIPNRTCEGGQLHEWEPKAVSYPLKGKTSVACLNESSSYFYITNISAADDGLPINCWGFTFDAWYTLDVNRKYF